MTRWFAWFRFKDLHPSFRVVLAESLEVAEMLANDLATRNKVRLIESLEVAEMLANDLATRNKVRLIGIIIASEQFNPAEKEE